MSSSGLGTGRGPQAEVRAWLVHTRPSIVLPPPPNPPASGAPGFPSHLSSAIEASAPCPHGALEEADQVESPLETTAWPAPRHRGSQILWLPETVSTGPWLTCMLSLRPCREKLEQTEHRASPASRAERVQLDPR